MRSSETKIWTADRAKILDDFARQVADGLWKKMPYKIWRGLAHNESSKLVIERAIGDCGWYEYTTTINIPSLTSVYEDFSYTFDVTEDSFGAYLDNVFGSPALSYVSEANNMSSSNVIFNDNTYNSISSTYPSNINSWSTSTIANTSYCDENDVRRICEKIINDNEKEKNKMDTSNLFNFDFGPASSNQFRMSPYGIAVRTQNNGWVAYNVKTGELFDVDIINFDVSKLIYKMPVALSAIQTGDILMHSGKPVFVRTINSDGTVGVIDYSNATVSNILPVKSPFGFNFFTKVQALVDLTGATANADNPFGNMLPFLMMSNKDNADFDPTPLLLMNGSNFVNNPMMMYFLLGNSNGAKNNWLPLLLMNSGNNPFGMNVSAVTDNPNAGPTI